MSGIKGKSGVYKRTSNMKTGKYKHYPHQVGSIKNKQDDRIKNLKLFKNNSEHIKANFHKKYHRFLWIKYICPQCKKAFWDWKGNHRKFCSYKCSNSQRRI